MPKPGDSARERFFSGVTSRELMSFPAISFAYVAQLCLHLASSVDAGYSSFLFRSALSIGATTPAFALIAISNRFSRREINRRILVLSSYVIGGALRGLLIHQGLIAAKLIPADASTYRIGSSAVVITLVLATTSYGTSSLRRANRALVDLRRENRSMAQGIEELHRASKDEDESRIQELVDTILKDLARVSDFEPGFRASRLEEIVNQTVRPLTRSFAGEVNSWRPAEFESAPPRFREFWRGLDLVRTLPDPATASLLVALSVSFSAMSLFSPLFSLLLVSVVGISLFTSMSLLFPPTRTVLRSLRSPYREICLTIAFEFVVIVPVVASAIVLRGTDNPHIYYPAGFILIPIFAWLVVITRASWLRLIELTKELEFTRQRLEWLGARINLLSWYHRGFIFRLLHGPIQNTIQVGLMQMQAHESENDGAVLDSIIHRIEISVREALVASHTRLESLQQVKDMWSSLVEVDVELAPECLAALADDSAAANIVVDLVQEGCSNAIRHGRATWVRVSGILDSDRAVITLLNNGTPAPEPMGVGMGSVFLDACTINWERTHDAEVSRLRMEIPVVVQNRASSVLV